MASEVSSMPNGNYGTHNSYDMSSYNGSHQHQSHHQHYQQSHQSYANNPASNNTSAKSNDGSAGVAKDEVGWYFVEQYYKTLSASPEKLYLFYNKRSQLVLGQESVKVDVCIGQKAIHDRFQSQKFENCKIRITNVDSQASDANILVQVIGELSLKSKPHQRFTQSFVLAGQTNGYFVLNDIFRYLVDEEDDEPTATTGAGQDQSLAAPSTTQSSAETSAGLTSSTDKSEIEQSANKVAEQIESKVSKAPEPAATEAPAAAVPTVNGTHKGEHASTAQDTQPRASTATPEASVQPEKPADPAPTPAKSPAAQAVKPVAPASEPTPKPKGPTSWARLAAQGHQKSAPVSAGTATTTTGAAAAPAAAASTSPAAPAQQPAKAQTAASAASAAPAVSAIPNDAPASTPAPAAAREPSLSNESAQQGGWTDVVADHHKRQQQKPQGQPTGEGALGRAYIKNIGIDVTEAELEQALSQFGGSVKVEITKQKNGLSNCAFVDFKDFQAYKSAVDANPHTVGGSKLNVEERKPRPFPARGGMGARGRGGANGAPRGDFVPRGRGGYQASRGNTRGGPIRGGRGGAPPQAA